MTASDAFEKVEQIPNIDRELVSKDFRTREAAVDKIVAIRNEVADEELQAFDDLVTRWQRALTEAAEKAEAKGQHKSQPQEQQPKRQPKKQPKRQPRSPRGSRPKRSLAKSSR